MPLRNIIGFILTVTTIFSCNCNARPLQEDALVSLLRKALQIDTDRSQNDAEQHQRCNDICNDCFVTASDTFQRTGCFEKCLAVGSANFVCPGSHSFIGAVPTVSAALDGEIKSYFDQRSAHFSAGNYDGIGAMFTEHSMLIIDKQIPVIGRDDRKTKIRDYIEANPTLGRVTFVPETVGEEYGIIWATGYFTYYDKQGKTMTTNSFTSLFNRVGVAGTLQEYATIIFPQDTTGNA